MRIRNIKWFGLTLALGIFFSQLLLAAHQTEHLSFGEAQDCQFCVQVGSPALPGPVSSAGLPPISGSSPSFIPLVSAPDCRRTLPTQPRAPPPRGST